MNQSSDFKRINHFEFIEVESNKSIAWLTYKLVSEITRESRETVIQWLETVVLSRHGNKCKVTHLHSTLIKRS